MELAFNIVKETNKCSLTESYVRKLQELNLKKKITKNNYVEFMKKINSDKYVTIAKDFLSMFFNTHITDITHPYLYSYCIIGYGNIIFDYQLRSEIKLITAANSVVYYTELILNNKYTNTTIKEFINAFDNYYALFKLWMSKDDIILINSKIEKIQSNTLNEQQICDKINLLFKLNTKCSIKLFLENYEVFNKYDNAKKLFWSLIKYDNEIETKIVLLIADIRHKLIKRAQSPECKKSLYYNIDIEDIVSQIRKNEMNYNYLKNIIDTLQTNLHKIDTSYKQSHKLNHYNFFGEKSFESCKKIFRNMNDFIVNIPKQQSMILKNNCYE